MIIWKGYYYFRKSGGWIYQTNLKKGHHGTLRKGHSKEEGYLFDIIVRKRDKLEEKVKTILHELGHIGAEYEIMTNPSCSDMPGAPDYALNSETILAIERATMNFYYRNPPLVQKIRELLKYKKNFKLP